MRNNPPEACNRICDFQFTLLLYTFLFNFLRIGNLCSSANRVILPRRFFDLKVWGPWDSGALHSMRMTLFSVSTYLCCIITSSEQLSKRGTYLYVLVERKDTCWFYMFPWKFRTNCFTFFSQICNLWDKFNATYLCLVTSG